MYKKEGGFCFSRHIKKLFAMIDGHVMASDRLVQKLPKMAISHFLLEIVPLIR